MTYEVYRNIFTIAGVAAIVMVVVSLFLFFKLRIMAVIGDLTGATARKGIEAIRTGNEKSGDKKFGSSKVNLKRGRLTAKITPSGNLQEPGTGKGYGINTQKLASNETTVLDQPDGAVVLSQYNETTVLNQPSNETTVLSQSLGGASMWQQPISGMGQAVQVPDGKFEILQDITVIHTDEMIVLS